MATHSITQRNQTNPRHKKPPKEQKEPTKTERMTTFVMRKSTVKHRQIMPQIGCKGGLAYFSGTATRGRLLFENQARIFPL